MGKQNHGSEPKERGARPLFVRSFGEVPVGGGALLKEERRRGDGEGTGTMTLRSGRPAERKRFLFCSPLFGPCGFPGCA